MEILTLEEFLFGFFAYPSACHRARNFCVFPIFWGFSMHKGVLTEKNMEHSNFFFNNHLCCLLFHAFSLIYGVEIQSRFAALKKEN
jgi:hypothetical protein